MIGRTQKHYPAPLAIPLPGGKKLRLGPGKAGQVAPRHASHPPLQKLIEAGDVEVVETGRSKGTGGSSGSGMRSTQGGGGSGGIRHTGDR